MMVRKASLGKLTFLAEGRFGGVFRAERFRLRGDGAALAYKEFTTDRTEQVKAAVAFRRGLSPADRGELDQYCSWPRALVEDASGKVCGFLMPLVPAAFCGRQADPDSGGVVSRPRALSWLIASAAQRSAARVDLPEAGATERLILLAQLVYAIARLHSHGWVYGDLSFARAVFALDPPRMMLLGCDGAAALADPGRKQPSTPGWDPPECPIEPPPGDRRLQERQDTVTDTYKLGLAVLRFLVPGPAGASSGSVSLLPGELDPVGADLVTRALSADRGQRPTAKDLYGYLHRVVACRMATREPVTVSFGCLPRPHVPALEALSLAPVTAAFAGRPFARVGVPDMPRPPSMRALDLVESLRPDRSAAVPRPRIDEAIAAASGAVRDLVLSEGQRYVAALRQARLGGGNDQARG